MPLSESPSMTPPAANFDAVAKPYRVIERLVYGAMLEEARFCMLGRWANARRLLLLGDGDGRCLARVLKLAPEASVVSIDASVEMLRLAKERLGREERGRVEFICADARTYAFGEGDFDGIGTLFFMDCFEEVEVRQLAIQLQRVLRPGGVWIHADFEVVGSGLGKAWKRALIGLMYVFFRIIAGLRTRRLPNTVAILESEGFVELDCKRWWGGFVRASAFCLRDEGAGSD